jgi:uncharacterized RDD family membrane protein YckC
VSTIITGEAVALELREASFVLRAVGCIIDYVAYALGLIGSLVLLSSAALGIDEAAGRAAGIAVAALWLVAVPLAVETLTRGKSLGRLVMGLRIVRDDGGSIRFRHAFIRAMLALLEVVAMAGSLALLVAFANERGKRLGDMLAGTYSMRERRRKTVTSLPPVPAPLRPWAELAAELGRHVAPAPPPGTGAEEFLVAVMAERRERDFRRLTAARSRQESIRARIHRLPFEQE